MLAAQKEHFRSRGQTFQQTVPARREPFLNSTVIIEPLNHAGNQKFTRDQLMQR